MLSHVHMVHTPMKSGDLALVKKGDQAYLRISQNIFYYGAVKVNVGSVVVHCSPFLF